MFGIVPSSDVLRLGQSESSAEVLAQRVIQHLAYLNSRAEKQHILCVVLENRSGIALHVRDGEPNRVARRAARLLLGQYFFGLPADQK